MQISCQTGFGARVDRSLDPPARPSPPPPAKADRRKPFDICNLDMFRLAWGVVTEESLRSSLESLTDVSRDFERPPHSQIERLASILHRVDA